MGGIPKTSFVFKWNAVRSLFRARFFKNRISYFLSSFHVCVRAHGYVFLYYWKKEKTYNLFGSFCMRFCTWLYFRKSWQGKYVASGMKNGGLFLPNASRRLFIFFPSLLIRLYFLEPRSSHGSVKFCLTGIFLFVWSWEASVGFVGCASSQESSALWLVSLLVTFVAIWPGTCVCSLSPAGQGLGPEFADASLGLRFRDSRHLLVICRYSGVRGFQRLPSLESLQGVQCLTVVFWHQLPIRSGARPQGWVRLPWV